MSGTEYGCAPVGTRHKRPGECVLWCLQIVLFAIGDDRSISHGHCYQFPRFPEVRNTNRDFFTLVAIGTSGAQGSQEEDECPCGADQPRGSQNPIETIT